MMSNSELIQGLISTHIKVLGLDTEFQISPPMSDLLKSANEISMALINWEDISIVDDILLKHANPFAIRLGILTLRLTVHKYRELLIPYFLKLLNHTHPWNRYEAMWGLISTRSTEESVISCLKEFIAKSINISEADQKSLKMAQLYIENYIKRIEEVKSFLAVRTETINLSYLLPMHWQDVKSKNDQYTFIHKLKFEPTKVDQDKIRFAEFNRCEFVLSLNELDWDEDLTLEEYIKEWFTDRLEARKPTVENRQITGFESSLYCEFESFLDSIVIYKMLLLDRKRLFQYTIMFPRVEEKLWGNTLKTMIQSIGR